MNKRTNTSVEIGKLKGVLRESEYSVDALKHAHSRLSKIRERTNGVNKLQAEVSYLLAVKLQGTETESAVQFGRESVSLYTKLDIKTLEESLPILSEILPSYMHEGVVNARLGDLLRG